MILAKQLRIRISPMLVKLHDKEMRVTASFGVAGFAASQQTEGMTVHILLEKADQSLQQALEDQENPIKRVQLR